MDSKIFRLSGYMVMLLVLTLSIGCRQVTGQEDDQPAPKASGSDSFASAGNQENMSKTFEGTVAEVIDTGRHVYVQVDIGEKLVWVAVPAFDGKAGDPVIVPPGIPSANFHSRTLNRDFEMIYFVGGLHRVGEGDADQPVEASPVEKNDVSE